jgi:Ni,Fe-hydrogenase I small subunit
MEDDKPTCQYCFLIFKNAITLKCHMINNKKCMKIRGVKLETRYKCNGCNEFFINKANLNIHQEACKEYSILQATSDLQKKYDELLLENEQFKIEKEQINLLLKEKDTVILLSNKSLLDAHTQIDTLQKMLETIAINQLQHIILQ